MDKIYHALLWFCGFREGEHLSNMLARQKKRLGIGWWAFPIITITSCLAFFVWLTWHIATFRLKEE